MGPDTESPTIAQSYVGRTLLVRLVRDPEHMLNLCRLLFILNTWLGQNDQLPRRFGQPSPASI